MASSEIQGGTLEGVDIPTSEINTAAQSSEPTAFGQDLLNSIESISQPVEMSDLSSNPQPTASSSAQGVETPQAVAKGSANTEALQTNASPATGSVPQSMLLASQAPAEASRSESAIGPATDKPASQSATAATGPMLVITLLLHSTETRHPYTIDESYLKRRGVNVENNNPINMSVYTLKELILRDWRSEWEPKPNTSTSIRLIHMGRMLDDKAFLKDSRFSTGSTPHIVHMTIKPQEVVDEEDARIAKGVTRDRDGNERTPGCRCVVM